MIDKSQPKPAKKPRFSELARRKQSAKRLEGVVCRSVGFVGGRISQAPLVVESSGLATHQEVSQWSGDAVTLHMDVGFLKDTAEVVAKESCELWSPTPWVLVSEKLSACHPVQPLSVGGYLFRQLLLLLVWKDADRDPDDQSAWAAIPPKLMCLLCNEWVCVLFIHYKWRILINSPCMVMNAAELLHIMYKMNNR